jgi:hypothetical protein
MAQKKQQKKALPPTVLPDNFSLNDILNAPVRKKDLKHNINGVGCLHCGSTRIKAHGPVKVFRGQRMQPYHCMECGRDCYKDE